MRELSTMEMDRVTGGLRQTSTGSGHSAINPGLIFVPPVGWGAVSWVYPDWQPGTSGGWSDFLNGMGTIGYTSPSLSDGSWFSGETNPYSGASSVTWHLNSNTSATWDFNTQTGGDNFSLSHEFDIGDNTNLTVSGSTDSGDRKSTRLN